MYWADKLLENFDKSNNYRVDDMKTPSGHAHAGSLRAIATHGLIYEALKDAGYNVDFTYVINDMDPMDGLPVYLDKTVYEQHMGKPLNSIPSPDGKAENFAMFYANEYISAFNTLGFKPEIHKSSDLYKQGQIDKYIRMALDEVEVIRKIYKKVAGQTKPEGWYPFQVICPQCGKVGTSLVTDWDGELVTYSCEENLVEWTKGCGHKGRISPFGGTGKLMWKVDWPAHWAAMNISIEGAGKDHFSKGGSRYIAAEVIKDVFKTDPPFGFLHEFLLIGGAKMSSSKGNATSAAEFVKILPPQIGRFLHVRTPYQRAINFDPNISNTIPDLFDEYDRCAKAFFETGTETDQGRYFQAAQINKDKIEPTFLPRFRTVATLVQMPSVNLRDYFSNEKGSSLSAIEIELLNERVVYAKLWLERFAADTEKFNLAEETPTQVNELSESQLGFLGLLADMLSTKDFAKGEELQQAIFELAKSTGIQTKEAFAAIYISLIGKNHGPKAGWLLKDAVAKDKEKYISRLRSII